MKIKPRFSSQIQSRFSLRGSLLLILVAVFCHGFSGRDIAAQQQSPARSTNSQTTDWPSFLGVNRDGKSTQTGIVKKWDGGGLKKIWELSITESYAAPSIVGQHVYFFEREGQRNILRCLKVKDGSSVWQYRYKTDYRDMYGYNNGPRCSPVIDDGLVFIYGPEGEIHAVDLKSGAKRWSVDTAEKFGVVQNFFGVGSTPVIHKDLLIAMVGGSPEKSQSVAPGRLDLVEPNGTGIVAFEKKTGKIRYEVGNFLASYSSPVVTRIGGKPVGLALMREGLLGFNPDNGKELFRFDWRAKSFESVNASTPVVVGDQILISECYGVGGALLRWKNDKLQTVWSDRDRRPMNLTTHWNTPIVVDGHIYASCGRNSGNAELRCIELKTGKVKWSKRGFRRSTLTYADGHLVLLGEYGELLLFKPNPEKFEQITRFESDSLRLKYPCWAAPVICGGRMYILTAEKLICFQIAEKSTAKK